MAQSYSSLFELAFRSASRVAMSLPFLLSMGCPPTCKDPSQCPGNCKIGPENVKSFKLKPEGATLHIAPGEQKNLDVEIQTEGPQPPTGGVFCIGLLAGDLPTNRATDRRLGGTIVFAAGGGKYTSTIAVRCNENGNIEVRLSDDQGNFDWKTTGTRENGVYALTLPAGLFTPASSTARIKCD